MAIDPARLESLFDAVADLPSDEAARVLARECADVPELRAAVERLLEQDRRLGPDGLMPDARLLLDAVERHGRDLPEPPNPSTVGRFRILARLGEGAMGVVYVAYDESLDRRIALKVLRDGVSASLAGEAKALARLSHPNVVHVHEVGQHQGRPFVAMELVPGRSLAAWSRERTRASHEILRMFLQAARGLAAAHAAGIVHRDFKPDNVLVGEDGRARVADFGVAKVAAEDAVPHAVVGTPAFMAPEQFLREEATGASDQFAFCVSLYGALYDRPPFAGDDYATLERNVVAGALRAPPNDSNVAAWVAPILLRGLARHDRARFASMEELVRAIERRLPGDPGLDPNLGRRERRLLSGGMTLFAVIALVAFLMRGGSTDSLSAAGLIAMPVIVVVGLAVGARVLHRSVYDNRFGRRVGAVVLIAGATLVLHRLVALHFDQPVAQILAVDLLFLAMESALATLVLDRWFALAAGLFFAGCLVALIWPSLAFSAMALSAAASFASGFVVWRRES